MVHFKLSPKKTKKDKCEDSLVVLVQKVSALFFLALLFIIPFLTHLNDIDAMIQLYVGLPPPYDGSAITLIYYFLLIAAYFDVVLVYFVNRGSVYSGYSLKAKLRMFALGQTVSMYGIIVEILVISGGFLYGLTFFLIAGVLANIFYIQYIYIQCKKGKVF